MTRFGSVLKQVLELDERGRELLVMEVSLTLEPPTEDRFANPKFIAELERRSRHAHEHPETLMEWDEAEKEIFGGLLED